MGVRSRKRSGVRERARRLYANLCGLLGVPASLLGADDGDNPLGYWVIGYTSVLEWLSLFLFLFPPASGKSSAETGTLHRRPGFARVPFRTLLKFKSGRGTSADRVGGHRRVSDTAIGT